MADKLLEQTGIDNEYRKCGGLYIARTLGEKATLAANRVWWHEHGIPFQQLSRAEVETQHFRQASDETASVGTASVHTISVETTIDNRQHWWLPNDCRVRNPRHIQALVTACALSGVDIIEHDPVVDIKHEGDWIVCCRSARYQAPQVCLTAGHGRCSYLLGSGSKQGSCQSEARCYFTNCRASRSIVSSMRDIVILYPATMAICWWVRVKRKWFCGRDDRIDVE